MSKSEEVGSTVSASGQNVAGQSVTHSGSWTQWSFEDAAAWIRRPTARDDKYTRGVLGVRTGSLLYPGAAVLGVEAAMRTGVGMVRYLGPARPADLVLARRPETVTAPGRVQAWLLGSGMDSAHRDTDTTQAITAALAEGVPCVVDAGALDLVGQLDRSVLLHPLVVTPHYRELAALLGLRGLAVTADEIAASPGEWAVQAATSLNVTVLLKGGTTYIASPGGARLSVSIGTPWLATAGTGDVLGGILGALVATHAEAIETDADALAPLADTAALLHALAATRASGGGPIAALDVAEAVPSVIASLLAG